MPLIFVARDKYQHERPEVAAMYERMLSEQGGECAIRGCKRRPKTRRFHIDHDHATGKVRGLLCHWHNRIMPRDAAEALALADYLDRAALTPAEREILPSMRDVQRQAAKGVPESPREGTGLR
jgi:hypothetical protein